MPARQACKLMQRDLHSKDSALVEPADAAGGQLASLYLRWRIPVMRMLRRHFGTSAEVEDAAQEVFVRVAATGKVLRPEEEQPYLRQTLRSVAARDWHKSAQSQGLQAVAHEDCEDELQAAHGDDSAAQRQRLTRLHQAVQELPQRQRQAFVLHRIEGCTVQDTADQMGISLRMTVKHLARALAYCETRVLYASAEQMQRLQAMQASLAEEDDAERAGSRAQGETP
ncbi:RNA polymerase sigma factor [Comamonas sp.]|uniref:RNA polymerase sigma factor n=1 Tax=Comamonas sp. TaxID=34028 RepID=UPI002FC84830